MPVPFPHRPVRLQVMLSEAEIDLIDEWRFAMRIPTRAEAVRQLLRRGMDGRLNIPSSN